MSLCDQTVDATVDCTVRVARDADGTLADGAATQLARVDGIEAVERVDVAGIEPRLNDLAVDVEAAVRVTAPIDDREVEAAVQSTLAAGFGVDVTRVRLET